MKNKIFPTGPVALILTIIVIISIIYNKKSKPQLLEEITISSPDFYITKKTNVVFTNTSIKMEGWTKEKPTNSLICQ